MKKQFEEQIEVIKSVMADDSFAARIDLAISWLSEALDNNLPVLVLTSQIFLWLVGLRVLAIDIPFSIIAMLVSWSYLRFYYKFEDSGNVFGDRSDGFAFIAMFPEVRMCMCMNPIHSLTHSYIRIVLLYYGVFSSLNRTIP